MEGNILSLLQQGKQQAVAAAEAPPTKTESKWKHSKLKHDVLSNKKDFPLASAKPSKQPLPHYQRTLLHQPPTPT